MARIHARKRGKSSSTKPGASSVNDWLEYSKEEVEEFVVDLAKSGKPQSMIGAILRDQYGIPSVKQITKKTIGQILEKHELASDLPETLVNLLKKALKLRKHLENNKHDLSNNRGLQLTEAKIQRLVRYYKNKKVLPADFYYNSEKIELLLR